MTLLDLLRAHWTLWGLDAPKFAWLAALGLVAGPIGVLVWLFERIGKEAALLNDAAERILQLYSRIASSKSGLNAAGYAALADILGKSSQFSHAWNGYVANLVARSDTKGEQHFWCAEGAEASFTETALWGARLNRGFYNSLPAVVTSTGLLFTFLAILVALLDVRIDAQTNQIAGLPLLIEGLSGKFISSIAALLSAIVFLVVEKRLFHRLSQSRLRLVSAVDRLVPRLSSARLLAEMQNDMGAMAEWAKVARQSSAEQMELSKAQVKASTAVLHQFMSQMNETAGSSITHMAVRLTGVVRDLSDKVNDLGVQMAASLKETVEQNNEFSSTVVEKVEAISSRSAEHLDKVIEELHNRTGDAKEVEYQFASLNAALSEITSDVNVMSERLHELTESLQRLRDSADASRA